MNSPPSDPTDGAEHSAGVGAQSPFLLSWRLLTWIAALTAIFVGGTYSLYRLDDSAIRASGALDGFSSSVTQYQIAFYQMQGTLKAQVAGERVNSDELARQNSVLAAKASALTQAATVTQVSEGIEDYEKFSDRIKGLEESVWRSIAPTTRSLKAIERVLAEFEEVQPLLEALSIRVRAEENRRREATMTGLMQRRMLLWILLIAGWVLVLGWMITLTRSERRFRQKAFDEAAARRSEKDALNALEEAVRAKSNFLGMVSHELRSPLQVILSSLEGLERRASGESAEFVGRILHAANAIKLQLQDLLTLAAGEAGRLEIRPEAFEACDLVAGVVDMFVDVASKQGLALRSRLPEQPIFVVADAKRIVQVLTNLVSNGIRYTDAGQVTVELKEFDQGKSELTFIVTDTGRGISPEHLPDLFTAFARFGAASVKNRDGAGIGLAIVHTVVQHLGGRIKVASVPGEGSTFTVTIPAIAAAASDSRSTAESATRSVLFIDDRPEVLNALVGTATEMGFLCDKAGSAGVGANLLASRKYDVVFIDLDMPVKGGLQLALETRRGAGPNARTRLIAISAVEPAQVAPNWPFDGFLEKPILGRSLKEAILRRELD